MLLNFCKPSASGIVAAKRCWIIHSAQSGVGVLVGRCWGAAAAALYQLLLYFSDMQQLCLCPAFMITDCSTDAAALHQL